MSNASTPSCGCNRENLRTRKSFTSTQVCGSAPRQPHQVLAFRERRVSMRLRIVLGGTGEIFLPWEYPHLLHGLLYRAVIGENPEFGVFLHERGFGEDHHRYRLFVFSRIFPKKTRRCEEGLWCTPPLVFWVASPLAFFLEALASALLRSRRISLGNTVLFVKSIEVEPPPDFSGKVLCETLSPLVASTGVRRGGEAPQSFPRS